MHIIMPNAVLGFIEIRVSGFWSAEHFADFKRDLATAVNAFPGPRLPMSLYDYTEAAIQSQAVVAEMQALARTVTPDRSIALYTEGCLARQQAKRVASECANMSVFDNRIDALKWLAERRAPNALTGNIVL